jgi:2-hydroxychromene-2-carboxylate isomerase
MVLFPLSPLSPTPLPLAGEGLKHIAGFDFDFDFDFDLKTPAAASSIAGKAGVFGEDCLSAESASSAAARFVEKRREAEGRGGGVFLFGYFILDKQNKVPRLGAKK